MDHTLRAPRIGDVPQTGKGKRGRIGLTDRGERSEKLASYKAGMEQFPFMSAFRPAAVLAAFSRASEEPAPRPPAAHAHAQLESREDSVLRRALRQAIGNICLPNPSYAPNASLDGTAHLPSPKVPSLLEREGPRGPAPILASHFALVQTYEAGTKTQQLSAGEPA